MGFGGARFRVLPTFRSRGQKRPAPDEALQRLVGRALPPAAFPASALFLRLRLRALRGRSHAGRTSRADNPPRRSWPAPAPPLSAAAKSALIAFALMRGRRKSAHMNSENGVESLAKPPMLRKLAGERPIRIVFHGLDRFRQLGIGPQPSPWNRKRWVHPWKSIIFQKWSAGRRLRSATTVTNTLLTPSSYRARARW